MSNATLGMSSNTVLTDNRLAIVQLPIPEDQYDHFNRMWKYGDVGGGGSNRYINWSEEIENPLYYGGGNLVVADLHCATNFTRLIDFIVANKNNITCVVNCGDNCMDSFTTSESTTWMRDMYEPGITRIREAGIPYLCCVGNHDALNASINKLVSMVLPDGAYYNNDRVEAGLYTTSGMFSGNSEAQKNVLRARHLGYLYVIKNKKTEYIQPYLILNCYDSDDNDYERLLRSGDDTIKYRAYVSKTQIKTLMQDLYHFYNSGDFNLSKILPLITVSHHAMADQDKSRMEHIAVSSRIIQKRFTYESDPRIKCYESYAHRFQEGSKDWIEFEYDNNLSRISYLGMVAGEYGLSLSSDVVCYGSAVPNMASGITSDWTITKGELSDTDPLIADLYKRNGINLSGHMHLDYIYVDQKGAEFFKPKKLHPEDPPTFPAYPSAHTSEVVLSSIALLSSTTKQGTLKYSDIIYDFYSSYQELSFTMFGYTCSGYVASDPLVPDDPTETRWNAKVEWVLERYGRQQTMPGIDRDVEYFAYSPESLSPD